MVILLGLWFCLYTLSCTYQQYFVVSSASTYPRFTLHTLISSLSFRFTLCTSASSSRAHLSCLDVGSLAWLSQVEKRHLYISGASAHLCEDE